PCILSKPVGVSTAIVGYWHRYVVTREHNQIRAKSVHNVHAFTDGNDGEVFLVVEVAQLGNGESVEVGREPAQANVDAGQLRTVRLDKADRAREACPGGENSASKQKFSSSQQTGAG